MKRLFFLIFAFFFAFSFADEKIWFVSPTNSGINDELRIPLKIRDKRSIEEWRIEICDEKNNIVKTIENKEVRPEVLNFSTFFKRLFSKKIGVKTPNEIRWNCVLDSGEVAPDGHYFFTVYAKDDVGNETLSEKREFVIDTVPPRVLLKQIQNPDDLVFSPGSDTAKSLFKIEQSGSVEDEWTGVFTDIYGKNARTIKFSNSSPSNFSWDGRDDEGYPVSDGVYAYSISAVDKAGNSVSASIRNIIVDTVKPELALTLGDTSFSPNGDGKKDELPFYVSLSSEAGLQNWQFEIKNSAGKIVKSISDATMPPSKISFDGKDENGEILPDGSYSAQIKAQFRNGWSPKMESPTFLLKNAPPVAQVSLGSTVFSPDGDGTLDVLSISQKSASDANWSGAIMSVDGSQVKHFDFGGNLPAQAVWGGLSDSGEIAPDGKYFYRLCALDSAGNSAVFDSAEFELDTRLTEIILTSARGAFNPAAQGERGKMVFKPVVKSSGKLAKYSIQVNDASGKCVKTFSGAGALPAQFEWDGKDDNGNDCADGAYSALLETFAENGNRAASSIPQIVIDSVAPQISASAKNLTFNPLGKAKPTVQFEANSSDEALWLGEIRSAKGDVVRSMQWEGGIGNFVWDGRDDAGNISPNGEYLLHIWTEDAAGNFSEAKISDIVLDAREPKGYLTLKNEQIAPASDDARNKQTVFINADALSGIEKWTLALKNSKGAAVKTWSSPNDGGEKIDLPKFVEWNGLTESGAAEQGIFYAALDVLYEKGDNLRAVSGQFISWNMPPEVSASTKPKFFSPDNDGENDDLFISLDVKTPLELDSWSFCVKDPQNGSEFWKIGGNDSVPETLVWDGFSNRGELVQSATDYPWEFHVLDKFGQENIAAGSLSVDILVLRFGDVLKIQIPSIVFADSRSDFQGLPRDVVEKNRFVLRRIAQSLNKFKDYRVTIEGHANKVERTEAESNFNLKLSGERAESIKKMLTRLGVAESRLSTVGKGDLEPIIPYEDKPNWWKNRRVEFILEKK